MKFCKTTWCYPTLNLIFFLVKFACLYKLFKNICLTEQLNMYSGEEDLNFEFQTKATPSGSRDESSYDANNNSGY